MVRKAWEVDRQGGKGLPWLPHVTGRYYASPVFGGNYAANQAQPGINILYGQCFVVPTDTTYTGIGARLTLGNGAGRLARLGIYNDTNGGPSSLVLDAGTIDLSSTGDKLIAISQALTAGWYWLALVCNNASPNFFGAGVASCFPWIGTTTTSGVAANFPYVSVAFTYAALPNPFTAGYTPGSSSVGMTVVHLVV